MQVLASWRPTPGQATWVNFEIENRVVRAHGVVVWSTVTGSGYRWGIRFTSLHRSTSEIIEWYVGRGTPLDGGTYDEDEPSTLRWQATPEQVPDGAMHTQIVSVRPSTELAIPHDNAPVHSGVSGLGQLVGPSPSTVPFDANTYVAPLDFQAPAGAPGGRHRRPTLIDLPDTHVGPAPQPELALPMAEESPTAVASLLDGGDAPTGVRAGSPTADESPTAVTSVSASHESPTAVTSVSAAHDSSTDILDALGDASYAAISSLDLQLDGATGVQSLLSDEQPTSVASIAARMNPPTGVQPVATPDEPSTTVSEPKSRRRSPRGNHTTQPRPTVAPVPAPAEAVSRAARRLRVEAILETTHRRQKGEPAKTEAKRLDRTAAARETNAQDEREELLLLYRAALKDLV